MAKEPAKEKSEKEESATLAPVDETNAKTSKDTSASSDASHVDAEPTHKPGRRPGSQRLKRPEVLPDSERQKTEEELAEEVRKERTSKEEIESVRARLYDRSLSPKHIERTELKTAQSRPQAVPRAWGQPANINAPVDSKTGVAAVGHYSKETMPKKHRAYRSILLIFGFLFFIVTLAASSVYMFMGGNTISGSNISVAITGPSTINGGEVLNLQVGVTNQNPSPIKSASLIVRYPSGTRAPGPTGETLQREVIQLENIAAGESLNIPIRALVFGEEDEQKSIYAEVEYQVEGSNGIFFKEAVPHEFAINISPVVVNIESLSQVTSGQLVDVNMIVRSNANVVLHDLLVEATYPFGFSYDFAKPEPVSGRNIWSIKELQPGETVTLTTRGTMVGLPSDERVFEAKVGVAGTQNDHLIASIYSSDSFSYKFEKEFIDLRIAVNSRDDETITAEHDDGVRVDVEFRNPLEETIYDAELAVKLSGSALNEEGVEVPSGFYDSIKNTVIFDRNTMKDLKQIQPGQSVLLSFTLTPASFVEYEPDIEMTFESKATRILENSVPESLVGTKSRLVRFQSIVNAFASLEPISGPIAPIAEKLTQYKVAVRVESGTNDLENAEVKMTLPTYVTWFDIYGGDGEMEFLNNSRTVTWTIGTVPSNSARTAFFNVGFLPSISQVGKAPIVVGIQNFSAKDLFTGTTIRDTSPAVTTVLSPELGYDQKAGVVRRTENE